MCPRVKVGLEWPEGRMFLTPAMKLFLNVSLEGAAAAFTQRTRVRVPLHVV